MQWVDRSRYFGLVVGLALGVVGLVPAADKSKSKSKPMTDEARPWAFRSPQRPALPEVRQSAWIRNPIDAFILARLEAAGLQPAPEADRPTLIRRLSYDLTGLPPTPTEVAAFVNDAAPDAYEKLVDRLLASPRFGERWALFWLDLVRYAESDGFKADDKRPYAWRYRDYVIQAFNEDKPYDRFLREQIAGDELYSDDPQAVIATGFHRHVPFEYNAVNLEQRRQETLNDMTDTTSMVFLGLTMGCARCHDHKFDPISQEDYYRLQAFFAGFRPVEKPLARAEDMERFRDEMRRWEEKTASIREQMSQLEEPERDKMMRRKMSRFPKEYQDIYLMPAEKRSPLQQQIAELVAKQVEVGSGEIAKSMKGPNQQRWQELNKQMESFERLKPPAPPAAMVLSEVGPQAPPTHLLKRGDWNKPEREIVPGYLSAIHDAVAEVPPPSVTAATTGRRTVLAEWLTQPTHPLTGRVMANRLWQHHFGRGIVGTPSDFGAQGEAPTHPELLDWLATELVARGWSLKALHRLMVTSSTYRQAARVNEAGLKADSENRLLWRMNRRRLEGETLRDALLAVSGRLNLKDGGPSVYPEMPAELSVGKAAWPISSEAEADRRSVYVFVKRNLRYPLFNTFDAPDSNEPCARRHNTTTAPQALMLLNGDFSLKLAQTFAERLLREIGTDPVAIVNRACHLSLGRGPTAKEAQTMRAFLERETSLLQPQQGDKAFAGAVTDLCHALFNLNEFLYVD